MLHQGNMIVEAVPSKASVLLMQCQCYQSSPIVQVQSGGFMGFSFE